MLDGIALSLFARTATLTGLSTARHAKRASSANITRVVFFIFVLLISATKRHKRHKKDHTKLALQAAIFPFVLFVPFCGSSYGVGTGAGVG
jgi:uncharacterized membrane protein YfcA